MSKYQRKFITNLLSGLFFVTTALFFLFYVCFNRKEDDWKLWAVVVTAITITGLLLLGRAFVSKVKADFLRKQKSRAAG